jgi:hypothetical protein
VKKLDSSKRGAVKNDALKNDAINLKHSHIGEVPIGENIKVCLDGRSWARSLNLQCYFEDLETGILFTVSVLRIKEVYCDKKGNIDFSKVGIIGNRYLLTINKSEKAKFPSLISAELIFLD